MSVIRKLVRKSASGPVRGSSSSKRGGIRKSASEIHLSSLHDLEFRKWMNQSNLNKHTRQMLALEHFDSMATIKMLRPDMIDLLHLSEDESNNLLKALGKLHMTTRKTNSDMTSDSGYVDDSSESEYDSDVEDEQRMSSLKHSISLPSMFTGNFLPDRPVSFKKGDNPEEISGGSPASFYIHSSDDSQSLVTVDSVVESVHSLREEELRDLLEYMVLEGITTRDTQEEILSKNSYRRKVELLKRVMSEAGETTRESLEEILRTNYNASLPGSTDRLETSWVRESLGGSGGNGERSSPKRVSWATKIPSDYKAIKNNNNRTELKMPCMPLDPQVFIINVGDSRTTGYDNPFFENDDGRLELPKSPLLRFGHKGRQDGELQDATSILSLSDDEIIVTDLVNSKLQIFDNFGAPVKTLSVTDKFQPWNVVLSPHGWLAVTFRSSKSLCILNNDGFEIASIGGEIHKNPAGLAVDKKRRYIVTDAVSNNVYIHSFNTHSGRFVTETLNDNVPFNQPRYVTISPDEKIIVSDSGNHCVRIFSSEGQLESQFGCYGQKPGHFRSPYGVCTDHQGNILVADHYNNRVSMFSKDGCFLRNLVTENHGLKRPQGLHISRDRKLFITHGRMKASEILVFDLAESNHDTDEETYL